MPALVPVLAEPDCGGAVALVDCGKSHYVRRKFKKNITRVPSFCRYQLWLMPALVPVLAEPDCGGAVALVNCG